MEEKKYGLKLLYILILKAILMGWIIEFSSIGLSPDEAQYWTWSQSLDIGYYSKPPGISWGIFLGTSLFSNTLFGIRFYSLLIGFFLPIATYLLGKAAGLKNESAFYSSLMMAFSPIGFAASFFATTDGSLVLFWVIATFIFLFGFRNQSGPNYYFLGIVLAIGGLFKWPIYLFWIFPILLKRFWNHSLFYGILISFLGLVPSFIWNFQHDFATFRHVFATVYVNHGHQISENRVVQGNFFDFLGAQVGLISPIFFVLVVIASIYLIKNFKKQNDQIKFCFISSIPILMTFAFVAIFKKMQGNWAVFVYPAAFVMTAYIFLEVMKKGKRWIQFGILFSILLTLFVVFVPKLQIMGFNIPYRLNPFKHNVGWDRLENVLKNSGYHNEEAFLFADKYQITSLLSFYGENKKRAYFFNLDGIRKNQFSYWPSMKDQEIGKTGYFVVVENLPQLELQKDKIIKTYLERLSLYFDKVEFLGVQSLYEVSGKMSKGAFIFKCEDYRGNEPTDVEIY